MSATSLIMASVQRSRQKPRRMEARDLYSGLEFFDPQKRKWCEVVSVDHVKGTDGRAVIRIEFIPHGLGIGICYMGPSAVLEVIE